MISMELDLRLSFANDGNRLKAPESILVKLLNERSSDRSDLRPCLPPNDDDVTVPFNWL